MNKVAFFLMTVVAAGFSSIGFASNATGATMKEDARKRTGGLILDTRKQTGSVALICVKGAADSNLVMSVAKSLETMLKVRIVVKDIDSANTEQAHSILAKSGSNAGVIIADNGPDFIVSPDECWSFINVASLKGGNVEKRIERQICRAFAYACGAGSSTKETIMAHIEKPADLETFSDSRLTYAATESIMGFLDQIGVKPAKQALYIRACREGWAPPPSDEYQKAIWDKVHSIPDKSLKIEFDPATQKGKVTK